MDLEDEMRPDGIKGQRLSSRSASSCFCGFYPAVAPACIKSSRCHIHEFRGAFSSIVPHRTKADPTAMPIVGFSG